MVNAYLTLYYMSFLSLLDPAYKDQYGESQGAVKGFENIDDTPYLPQTLPFPFLLASQLVRTVYLDLNGAIHATKRPSCYPGNTFSSSSCSLVNNYTETLAGWLTDLDANNCPSAQLKTYQSSHSWTVQFEKVCYFGESITSSFSLSLYADHSVVIDYIDIYNASLVLSGSSTQSANYINYTTNTLLTRGMYNTGYRFSPRKSNKQFVLDQKQFLEGRTVWSTLVPGIYPPNTRLIQSGYQYQICPTSTNLRAQNNFFTVGGSNERGEILILQPVLLSCAGKVSYTLNFTSLLSSTSLQIFCPVYRNTTGGEGYLETGGEEVREGEGLDLSLLQQQGIEDMSIICNMSKVLEDAQGYFSVHSNASSPFYYNYTLSYSPSANVKQNNTALSPLIPLPASAQLDLTYPRTLLPFSSPAYKVYLSPPSLSPAQCEVSPPGSDGGQCLKNNLCAHNNTCYYPPGGTVSNTCAKNTSTNAFLSPRTRVFYDTYASSLRTCNNTCLTQETGAGEDGGYVDYYYDAQTSRCCGVKGLDCAGSCPSSPSSPSSVLVRDSNNATICCSPPQTVDCAGICGGETKRDACGVCGGQDFVGSSCFDIQDIYLSFSPNNPISPLSSLNLTLDLSGRSFGNFNFSQRLYLTNRSPSNITFVLSISPPGSNVFPQLSLSPPQYPLLPILWTYLPVNSTRYLTLRADWNTLFRFTDAFPTSSAFSNNKLWEVQTLVLQARRVEYNSVSFSRSVQVFPRVEGCEDLASLFVPLGALNLCRALPGCFYCFSLEDQGYRIVRTKKVDRSKTNKESEGSRQWVRGAGVERDGVEEKERTESGGSMEEMLSSLKVGSLNEWGREGGRRLFSAVVPPKAQGHGALLAEGQCKTLQSEFVKSTEDICPNI